MQENELIPHLFRTEYSKIVAVLCHSFRLKPIEIAEDIASETFLKAAEVWSIKGAPDNPTAWLYTVAKNKAKDHFKHNDIFEKQVKASIETDRFVLNEEFEFNTQTIADSQLAMIFLVCNPRNSTESQICLALQILCGFSVQEIANAFLAKFETIKRRLHRARTVLRNDQFRVQVLTGADVKQRLDAALRCLYLLYNEGYYSKTNDQLIRKDLCSEAIRLALVLTENPLTNTAEAKALLALMYLQSSRLDARTDQKGEAILFDDQDRSLWDKELIHRGNLYLTEACSGSQLSKYHLEAAIAWWHTTSDDKKKWPPILQLYNELILIEYSPITALNRAFAFAKVYGHKQGIAEAKKLELADDSNFHSLLGYLNTTVDIDEAIRRYEIAIDLTDSRTEKQTLRKKIERLSMTK